MESSNSDPVDTNEQTQSSLELLPRPPRITVLPPLEEDSAEQPSSEPKPLLQDLCPICHINLPKYTCPACGTRSCSLQCSKKHKVQMPCTGELDPTKYQSRDSLLSSAHLLDRDYNFIQRIDRKFHVSLNVISDKMKQPKRKRAGGPSRGNGRNFNNKRPRNLPNGPDSGPAQFFNKSLTTINGVNIYQLPPSLSRALQNRTGYSGKKTKYWAWSVEWLYKEPLQETSKGNGVAPKTQVLESLLDARDKILEKINKGESSDDEDEEDSEASIDNSEKSYTIKISHNIPETELLSAAAVRYLHLGPKQSRVKILEIDGSGNQQIVNTTDADKNTTENSETMAESPQLPDEQDTEVSDRYNYYLKMVHTPANAPVAILLDGSKSILENLQGRSVVEFPTIFVIPKESQLPPEYTIVTPEDDSMESASKKEEKSDSDSSSDDSSDSSDSTDSSDESTSDDDSDSDDDEAEEESVTKNVEESTGNAPLVDPSLVSDDDDDEPPEESSSKNPTVSI